MIFDFRISIFDWAAVVSCPWSVVRGRVNGPFVSGGALAMGQQQPKGRSTDQRTTDPTTDHGQLTTDNAVRRFVASSLALLLLAGCVTRPKPGYYGPTDPMATVVNEVNANNILLPTLFAHHYTEANIRDPQKNKTTFINAGGDLFVRKPHELLMRGKKDLAGLIFELGSTEDRYWLTVFAGEDTMWWGWHRNDGKDCVRQIPFRPDLLGEVLGINAINTSFTQPPVPVMRFNNDLDVYMIVWQAALPGRWYAEKEVWYERQTKRPVKVLLFDRGGRIVLRADLTQHQQVAVSDAPKEHWPWIATAYDLFFPETQSTMSIKLSDPALTSKSGHPKPGTIRFPEDSGVPANHVIQIDKDCEK